MINIIGIAQQTSFRIVYGASSPIKLLLVVSFITVSRYDIEMCLDTGYCLR